MEKGGLEGLGRNERRNRAENFSGSRSGVCLPFYPEPSHTLTPAACTFQRQRVLTWECRVFLLRTTIAKPPFLLPFCAFHLSEPDVRRNRVLAQVPRKLSSFRVPLATVTPSRLALDTSRRDGNCCVEQARSHRTAPALHFHKTSHTSLPIAGGEHRQFSRPSSFTRAPRPSLCSLSCPCCGTGRPAGLSLPRGAVASRVAAEHDMYVIAAATLACVDAHLIDR